MTGTKALQREPQHLTLPSAPESVSVARHAFEHWLDGDVPSQEFAEDCRLVVSELVGNAVRHAEPLPDGTVVVAWAADGDGVAISVTDGGAPTKPRRVSAGLSDLAGRGLAIVEALCARWWVEKDDHATTVRARVPLAC